MLWQAEADFYFRIAEGHISPDGPRSFTVYPGFGQMRDGLVIGEADLRRLADAKGITTIVVRSGDITPELEEWNRFLPTIARGRRGGRRRPLPARGGHGAESRVCRLVAGHRACESDSEEWIHEDGDHPCPDE